MGPEYHAYRDKCFICQLDLDVQSLAHCQVMPCCGKFNKLTSVFHASVLLLIVKISQ